MSASVAIVWVASAIVNASSETAIAPSSNRSVPEKLLAVTAPFVGLTPLQGAVMLGAYGFALIALLRGDRHRRLLNAFAVSGPAFLLLYFLTPRHVLGAGEAGRGFRRHPPRDAG